MGIYFADTGIVPHGMAPDAGHAKSQAYQQLLVRCDGPRLASVHRMLVAFVGALPFSRRSLFEPLLEERVIASTH
jgi:hypothetical protein